MENNQESRTGSESNLTAVEENQSQNGFARPTTNDLHSNGHLAVTSDEIDKIRSEKKQGKIQIGQWCYEINVGTVVELPPSIDHHITSAVRTNSSVIHKKQRHHKKKSTKQISSISNSIAYQLTTTNENPVAMYESIGESIEVSLLHPLKEQLNPKTERFTKLMDYFDKPPVLIVYNDNDKLLDNTSMEIAMISRSPKGDYYSIYRFPDDKDTICRQMKTCGHGVERIELSDLRYRKKPNYDMKDNKNNKTFKLKSYSSDEEEDTMLSRPKDLINKYNLKELQLAIRFFRDRTPILHPFVFYSNPLSDFSDNQPVSRLLNISVTPCGKIISFDYENRCQMELSTELPEILHCTLRSGCKWFEISIITEGNLSSIYCIDFGNGDKKNPNYFNIKNEPLHIFFGIVKRPLCTIDHSHFQIQIRLLHSEGFPNQSSRISNYLNYETWKSTKFNEDITSLSNSIDQQQMSLRCSGQKRISEDCDYTLGLPTTKVPRTSASHEEQF